MRHGRKIKKLGRTKSHRQAMLANMVTSLFAYNIIKTTEAKAKEVRKLAERLITLAKQGGLHAHRQVYDVIKDRKLVKKIFDEIAPKLNEREGGYTRVLKLGVRRGDGAQLSIVELLIEKPAKEEKKGKKEKGAKKEKSEKEETKKAKGKPKAKPEKSKEKKEKPKKKEEVVEEEEKSEEKEE
jgi:large subunit ribosomal protein L17